MSGPMGSYMAEQDDRCKQEALAASKAARYDDLEKKCLAYQKQRDVLREAVAKAIRLIRDNKLKDAKVMLKAALDFVWSH